MREIGTVTSTIDGPSPNKFSFVVKQKRAEIPVRKNQFIQLESEEGKLIGIVTNIIKTNRYYMRAESVHEYERNGSDMKNIFPTDKWEYLVAEAQPLGVYKTNLLTRTSFPPSPGSKVYLAEQAILQEFLGVNGDGLHMGEIEHHNLPVKLNLTRLLQKHLALLALSGAGKSYCVSVLLEELLSRKPEQGKVGVVIIDTHGEYTNLAEPNSEIDYSDRVKVINAEDFLIGASNLSAYHIADFIPKMSSAQKRELARVLSNLRRDFNYQPYSLGDIIRKIETDENINENTKRALVSWIYDLDSTNLFNKTDYPCIEKTIKAGHLLVIDLSNFISIRKKQIIVTYLSKKLFNLRRDNKIPPYLEIIEEAHQFAPESISRENAISRGIIETIAREGRKFYASLCLISQRPVQLSTTALSQCNSHILLKITNPYDLDHIKKTSEGITIETANALTTLPVGNALIVGEAVNHPFFFKVRQKKTSPSKHEMKLEEAALKYSKTPIPLTEKFNASNKHRIINREKEVIAIEGV